MLDYGAYHVIRYLILAIFKHSEVVIRKSMLLQRIKGKRMKIFNNS